MNMTRWAALTLLSLPVLELVLLIMLGGVLGFVFTLALLLGAVFLGAWLLRTQGFSAWQRLQQSLTRGEYPTLELVDGLVILAGGALLLFPGFLSDLLALPCIIPATRTAIRDWLVSRRFDFGSPWPSESPRSRAIEGEFTRED
jgi:UPF0716 protein FxsA